jgi:hypothetical protein
LPVIVYRGQSPLFPDFLAQLDRRKHIPARGVKEDRQFVNVWTDGPNQLNGLARQGSVDRALNLHAADVCVTVQVVNIGSAPGGLLVDR